MTQEKHTTVEKVGAALFYGISSLAIMFVNKTVLSVYGFPSFTFLAASQAAFTVVALNLLHCLGKVKLSSLNKSTVRTLAPLVIISFVNVTSGLAGTKRVNMPMFTVLRRFGIPITMGLEWVMLNSKPSGLVQASVWLMILGTVVAALYDLTFDLQGYVAIMLSNLFTSLNGVVMKKTIQSSELTSLSVLYHISWASMLLMLTLVWMSEKEVAGLQDFEHWHRPEFLFSFFLASAMGSILNYSIFLCTAINSALATSVVGCLKNVLSTYLGMLLFSDYIFSWANFLGLNISIIGSLLYGYAEIAVKQRALPHKGSDNAVHAKELEPLKGARPGAVAAAGEVEEEP